MLAGVDGEDEGYMTMQEGGLLSGVHGCGLQETQKFCYSDEKKYELRSGIIRCCEPALHGLQTGLCFLVT